MLQGSVWRGSVDDVQQQVCIYSLLQCTLRSECTDMSACRSMLRLHQLTKRAVQQLLG